MPIINMKGLSCMWMGFCYIDLIHLFNFTFCFVNIFAFVKSTAVFCGRYSLPLWPFYIDFWCGHYDLWLLWSYIHDTAVMVIAVIWSGCYQPNSVDKQVDGKSWDMTTVRSLLSIDFVPAFVHILSIVYALCCMHLLSLGIKNLLIKYLSYLWYTFYL